MNAHWEHERLNIEPPEGAILARTRFGLSERKPSRNQQRLVARATQARSSILYNRLASEQWNRLRMERISELQAQVKDGTYAIESMVVAECILKNETYLA